MASHFFRYLDTNGDGSGTMNAIGDYSLTPTAFYYQPPITVKVHKAVIMIESLQGMWAERYGNIMGGLTNGYSFCQSNVDDVVQIEINNGIAVKSNAELGRTGFDVDVKTWGAGNEVLLATCNFNETGAPLELKANNKMSVTLNDDFSGLIQHFFMLQGILH